MRGRRRGRGARHAGRARRAGRRRSGRRRARDRPRPRRRRARGDPARPRPADAAPRRPGRSRGARRRPVAGRRHERRRRTPPRARGRPLALSYLTAFAVLVVTDDVPPEVCRPPGRGRASRGPTSCCSSRPGHSHPRASGRLRRCSRCPGKAMRVPSRPSSGSMRRASRRAWIRRRPSGRRSATGSPRPTTPAQTTEQPRPPEPCLRGARCAVRGACCHRVLTRWSQSKGSPQGHEPRFRLVDACQPGAGVVFVAGGLRRPRRPPASGQSVVEFALVLPILAILMLAIVDLGRIYTTMVSVESAPARPLTSGRSGRRSGIPRPSPSRRPTGPWRRCCIAPASRPTIPRTTSVPTMPARTPPSPTRFRRIAGRPGSPMTRRLAATSPTASLPAG